MADRVGQQLGNYQLMQLLGEGGFAEVYLGEHIHLGTQAAIKVLHTQLTSEDVDRFRTEARTVARLIHPNIVRVLEFGIEDKTPFLVMDYAVNGTLRQRHPRGTKLPLHIVISYVRQIADALQYAHDEKLIHRDIKPENMLLGRRNEILLSDFGIAVVAQSTRYQNSQDMAGTVAYMAPEQIQAHPRPASDQYSLGIVVYEWLTADRPFHGSFTEIAIKHSVVTPPPLRDKVPAIAPDVEQVVMTALAKDPKARFGSVMAFATALEQASQTGQTQFAVPGSQSLLPTMIVSQPLAPTVAVNPPGQSLVPTVAVNPPSQPLAPTILTPPLESPLPPAVLITPSGKAPGSPGTTLYTFSGHSGTVNAVAYSPDGTRIASGSNDGTVRIWNATKGHIIYTCDSHSARVNSVTWSPSGNHIAFGSNDQTVQIWNASTAHRTSLFSVHSSPWVWVYAVASSPDGSRIAMGSKDNTVQIWNVSSGSKIFTYSNHSRPVTTVAWSPNNMSIASGSDDKTVQVWQVNNGSKITTYTGHSSTIFAVEWSPTGERIASGSYDKTIHVWEATTGANVFTYQGHSGCVKTLVWSPEGKRIASGSMDGTVQVWDAATGSHIFTYRGHTGAVNAVAWSPDGKHIASVGDDKTVQIWVAP